jgi:protein SCO1/2/putative membrane protein
MFSSYRLGVLIVLGTVAAAAAASLATVDTKATSPRAANELAAAPLPLPAFRFTERSGRPVTDADLGERVWVGAFIFTRCPSSCPKISAVMKGLQSELTGTGVRLVSVSVDPEHDTPDVLSKYADGLGADRRRWYFLNAPRPAVYGLIREGFKLPIQRATPEEIAAGSEAVFHSSKLALVDRGNRVVGFYDSATPAEVRTLVAKAKQLDRAWVGGLPKVNAALNGLSTLLLLLGLGLILARYRRGHIACMVAALGVSALFLACYLVYHFMIQGGMPFQGAGTIRVLYFTILLSHVVLAAAVVPMILVTVYRAIRGQYARHAIMARVTYPVWLYVSVTGVVVYWMLYQMTFITPGLG